MIGSTLSLARWLGPWADAKKAPQVPARDEDLDGMRIRIYGRHGHPYLIAPGLHYAGPDDPRLDRFCRILANAGHLVIAPFIPDYLALMPSARAIEDFRRVFAAAPPNVHPAEPLARAAELERAWWHARVRETFLAADGTARFRDFEAYFATLWEHFARGAAWRARIGAHEALAALAASGRRLGVLSNFDQRLRPILSELGLRDFFDCSQPRQRHALH